MSIIGAHKGENKMKKDIDWSEIVAKVLVHLFLSPLFAMWIWNGTVAKAFGIATLGYWQMFWICFAMRLVTGGTDG